MIQFDVARFAEQVTTAKKKIAARHDEENRLAERAGLIRKNADILRLDGRDPVEEEKKSIRESVQAQAELSGAKAELNRLFADAKKQMDTASASAWARCHVACVLPYEQALNTIGDEIKKSVERFIALKDETRGGVAEIVEFDARAKEFNKILSDAGGSHALRFADDGLAGTLLRAMQTAERRASFVNSCQDFLGALGEVSAEERVRLLTDSFSKNPDRVVAR